MKIAISIEHPAWAHQFKNIIKNYSEIFKPLVIAVDKDGDIDLLEAFGIDYVLLAKSTGRNIIEKGCLFIKLCISYTLTIRKYQPDILIGRASPMMAIAGFFLKIPHVIFEDTEVSRFSLSICKMICKTIITPEHFLIDLGKCQKRMPIYKELFYLHEREFKPDRELVRKYGINTDLPYVVVRFVSWNASHDVGKKGLDDRGKISFIEQLREYSKVYISSEAELPRELVKYKLDIPYEIIHHVLFYAALVISEGASMASEAAVLGTHAFYLNEIASGSTEEQEKKYRILRVLHDPKTRYDIALCEAKEMLSEPDLWVNGKEKRMKMLEEMPNPNVIFENEIKEVVKLGVAK